jgi:hypothetical protein
MRLRRILLAGSAAVILSVSALALAPGGANSSQDTVNACITAKHALSRVHLDAPVTCPSEQAVSWPVSVPAPSPTPSPTQTSPTPTPSPTQTASGCVIHLGGVCGAYDYAPNVMSNGYNLYVEDQSVGPQTDSNTLTATDPGNWSSVENDKPYGYTGVQDYPSIQQQTNDWCGTVTNWATCNTPADTPLASLNSLTVNYAETSPQDANSIYEFGADSWNDNYGSDVMFWTDTHGRCNEGAYGGTILGTATFGGQTWTVNRYGGPGAEIIFILDSDPNTPNSCANQTSGTIDILPGYKWLVANGYMSSLGKMGLVTAGWEVTSADSTTFTVSSYSVGVS